jgi:flagellar hook-associated protein 3 FlgL
MRVTFNSFPSTLLSRLQSLSAAQNTALNQVSSGQRITVASDDSASAARVLNMRSEEKQQQQYWSNSSRALTVSQASYAAIEQLDNISTRASELAVTSSSDTTSADALNTYSVEVNHLLENAVSTANTKLQGDYLLAGTATDTAPFTVTRDAAGDITSVSYAGASDDGAEVRISETEKLSPSTTEAENRSVADFLNTLVGLRDAMRAGSPPGVRAVQGGLDTAESALVASMSRAGGVQYRLDVTTTEATNRFQALSDSISKETGVDVAQASITLSRTQTAYQAAVQSAAKIMSTSLLDYIQ